MQSQFFHWKNRDCIFKGVGIYHLTFVVRPRRPILGELVMDANNPRTALTPIGVSVLKLMEQTELLRPHVGFIAKRMMPDHLHLSSSIIQKGSPFNALDHLLTNR